MSLIKRESASHAQTVIVRLPEQECRLLLEAAGLRSKRTLASALQSCVTWMLTNLDRSLWDDILNPPDGSRRLEEPPAETPVSGDSEVDSGAGLADGEQPTIELVVIDEMYPDERRECRRYPMEMSVKAHPEGRPTSMFTGTTVNISTSGLLLITRESVECNDVIRVSVEWPLRSRRGKPLRLWSRAKVVWRSGDRAGLRIQTWEFCEAPLNAARWGGAHSVLTE